MAIHCWFPAIRLERCCDWNISFENPLRWGSGGWTNIRHIHLLTNNLGDGKIDSLCDGIQYHMVKRVAFNAAGWVLLLLGIIGLVLPVLPGLLFLIVGLSLLSLEYQWAHRWMEPLRRRFPKAEKKIELFFARHKKPASADASA